MTMNGDEFDLLRHLHLNVLKGENQLTREEKMALEEQRRMVLNETQYVAHRLQEKVSRMREQFVIRGRVQKPKSYTRDASYDYGFFWFGKGKYESDDDTDGAEMGKIVAGGRLSGDIPEEEEEDVPDERRFKIWRLINRPPLRGGVSGEKGPRAAEEVAPAARKKKNVLTPLWAEHYDIDTDTSQKGKPDHVRRQNELYRHGVLPRGVNGIDDILRNVREAQNLAFSLHDFQIRQDQKRKQLILKEALDEQLAEKRQLRLAQYEEELVHIYGPAMRQILNDAFEREPRTEEQQFFEVSALSIQGEPTQRTEQLPHCESKDFELKANNRARELRHAWLASWEDYKRRNTTADTSAVTNRVGDNLSTALLSSSVHYSPYAQQGSDNFLGDRRRFTDRCYKYSDLLGRRPEANIAGLNRSTSL